MFIASTHFRERLGDDLKKINAVLTLMVVMMLMMILMMKEMKIMLMIMMCLAFLVCAASPPSQLEQMPPFLLGCALS